MYIILLGPIRNYQRSNSIINTPILNICQLWILITKVLQISKEISEIALPLPQILPRPRDLWISSNFPWSILSKFPCSNIPMWFLNSIWPTVINQNSWVKQIFIIIRKKFKIKGYRFYQKIYLVRLCLGNLNFIIGIFMN